MRILLVDDHAIVRTGLRNLLTSVSDNADFRGRHRAGRAAAAAAGSPSPRAARFESAWHRRPGVAAQDAAGGQGGADSGAEHARRTAVCRACDGARRARLSQQERIGRGTADGRAACRGGWPVYRERDRAGTGAAKGLARPVAFRTSRNATWRSCGCWRKASSLAEIADALGIGYKTVANTCSHIKAKLGVTRTNDLVRLAMTLGVA